MADQQTHTEPLGQPYTYNRNYHKMSEFLGVNVYDRSDDNVAKKVLALQDWASNKTGKKDITSTLNQVARLQKNLGVHSTGKSLVTELYRHMRLSQENQKARAEIQQKVPSMRPQLKAQPKDTSVKGVIKQAIQTTITQAVKEAFK